MKVVFVVPNIKANELFLPNLLWPLLYFFAYITLLILFVKIFRFPENSWNFLNIYEILLLNKVKISLNTSLPRITFLFISFSAIGITAEFFSLLKKSIREDFSLNSFEDIANSNISIYCPGNYFKNLYLRKIKESLINTTNMPLMVGHVKLCMNKIMFEKQNAICIMNHVTAEYYKNKYLDISGHKLLKIIQDDLYGDCTALPYEYASPFLERFNKVKRRIIESDLMKHWEYIHLKPKIIDQGSQHQKIQNDHNIKWILVIIIFGYFMAILMFCSEILINKLCRK